MVAGLRNIGFVVLLQAKDKKMSVAEQK